MPKFQFNLQAVLTQRLHAEKEKQRALGVLLEQMARHEAELLQLDRLVKDASADLRTNRLTGSVDLAFIAAHRRFVLATERKARTVIQKMSLLQRHVDEARALLVEAARARRVVEKLRERKFEEWKANLLKQDQAEIDEVGSKLTVLEWQQELRDAELAAESEGAAGEVMAGEA